MNVSHDDDEWDNNLDAEDEEEDNNDQPQGYHALLDPDDEE